MAWPGASSAKAGFTFFLQENESLLRGHFLFCDFIFCAFLDKRPLFFLLLLFCCRIIARYIFLHFYECTVQPKRWARYGLADIFGGPKVLNSKIIVYLRNFGEKSMALANSCFEKWIIEFGRSLKSKGKMVHWLLLENGLSQEPTMYQGKTANFLYLLSYRVK